MATITVKNIPEGLYIKDALAMASESKCSAYDCEFAALALDLGIKLVTPDKVILSAFPEITVHIRKFEPL